MNLRIIILLFISCSIGRSYAQQEAQFTMFWNNYSMFNPAATGLFNKHFASVCGRDQWVGYKGAPITASAVYDFKWTKIKSGIGINYMRDQLGFEKNNKLNVNLSHQFNLKEDMVLSTGVSFGVLRKYIDFSKFIAINPNDPLLNGNADYYYNLNFGLMFKTPHLLAGLSSTQLNQMKSEKLNYKLRRHYFATCLYQINIGEKFTVKPCVFIKSDMTSTQFDFNGITTFKNRYWAGMSYRVNDAICFMGGVDIKGKYRIGYSYDHTISVIANYSKGTHEIVLALMLDQ